MALFGPSSRFLGRSGAQSGSQKYPKTCPDVVKKTFQKWTSFLLVLGLLLGPFWAQKSVGSGGPIFQGFSGWLLMAQERRSGADSVAIWPLLAPSWRYLGPSEAHLGPSGRHLPLTWATLDHLRPILSHLPYILCRITGEAIWGQFWCHLGPPWPPLSSILAHVGPICAHLAAIWTPSGATLDHLMQVLFTIRTRESGVFKYDILS